MFKEINHNGRRFFSSAAVMIVFAQLGVNDFTSAKFSKTEPANQPTMEVQQMASAAIRLPVEGEMPSLGAATEWLNSRQLTAAGLRGKVVLIDFWTYSCINWRR